MGYVERNREKFIKVYREYKDDVYRICLFFTQCNETAKDITQQVFLEYYEHIEQSDIQTVEAYLVRTARNKCYNNLRDLKKDMEREERICEAKAEEPQNVISVEEVFLLSEVRRQEREFFGSLLEDLRSVNAQWYKIIILIFLLGKPYDVVADELGLSKESLYSMLYRAKKWIHKNYTELYHELKKES